MASTLSSISMQSDTNWPFFYDPNFHVLGKNFRDSSSADTVAFSPLVTIENKLPWEGFSQANQNWITDGLDWDGVDTTEPIESIPSLIYKREMNGSITTDVGPGPFAPMWEISQAPTDSSVVNYDTLSHPICGQIFVDMQKTGEAVLSDLMNPTDFFGYNAGSDEPTSLLVYPITNNFASNGELVAALIGSFSWRSFFTVSLHNHDFLAVDVIVDDKCGQIFTLRVEHDGTTFQGYGDLHEQQFDQYRKVYEFAPFMKTDHMKDSTECVWTIRTYPTTAFYNDFNNDRPAKITTVVVCIFLGMSIIFCLYDCAVHTRQRRILAIAAQSERILSILYPKQIRDRLFGNSHGVNNDKPTKATEKSTSKKKRKSIDPAKNAKYQLKEFMNEDTDGAKPAESLPKEPFDDKPIADLVRGSPPFSFLHSSFGISLTFRFSSFLTLQLCLPTLRVLLLGHPFANHRKCSLFWRLFTMPLIPLQNVDVFSR